MVDQIIRPADLPNRASPNASEKIPVDNGSSVGGATVESIVLAGRPTASQAEAEAGTDAVKAMTPLTTKQSIASEVGVTVASKAQGDKADSAIQEIVEGTNVTVDSTDPQRPIISATGSLGYKTVADLLASTEPPRGVGAIWEADGFRYAELLSSDPSFHVQTAGGVRLLVKPNGRAVQPAMFGVADDGDPEEDVTTQVQKMAAFARSERLVVKFGPRKYVLSTRLEFNASVIGTGLGANDTYLKSTATTQVAQGFLLISGSAVVSDLTFDANASADPVTWTSANYDSFTGHLGMYVVASDVLVRNVRAKNTRRAGFTADAGIRRVKFLNCSTNRSRGNFGDGFTVAAAEQISFENCTAYDFTRIGFVSDSYHTGLTEFSARIAYKNCRAEYGHDASILFGGTEYNVGFWSETTGDVVFDNCHSVNVYHGGFRMVSGADPDAMKQANYSARNCTVKGGASQYGFVVAGLGSIPVKATLETCHAENSALGAFAFTGTNARDHVTLINCGSRLSGTSSIRASVALGVGTAVIEGFTEYWDVINTTYRDAIDNYYGSISHSGNAAGKCVVRDWKSFDASNNQIGSVFKFTNTARASLEFMAERCRIFGTISSAKTWSTVDCVYEPMGQMDVQDWIVIQGGEILSRQTAPFTTTINLRNTTKYITLDGVNIDLTASGGYLYFYNQNSSNPWPKISLRACQIKKNFETGGYAMRVSGDSSVINTANANHIVASDNIFINTGDSTTNPIFQMDSPTDGASKIYGRGNLKSSTISNIANSSAKVGTAASFENWS